MVTIQNKNFKTIPESLNITKKYKALSWWNVILISLAIIVFGQLSYEMLFGMGLTIIFSTEFKEIISLFSFPILLLTTIIVNKYYNNHPITTLGFLRNNWLIKYIYGILFAIIMLLATVGGAYLLGAITLKINTKINWSLILLLLCLFMIQGMTEEVIFRGYLQNNLAVTQKFWFAIIIQAVCFGLAHSMNDGVSFMALFNLSLFGIVFGLLF